MNLKWSQQSISILIVILGCSFLSFFVSGCSWAPSATEMIPSDLGISQSHKGSLGLLVRGGGKSWTISNEAFREALKTSILQSKVFVEIVEGEGEKPDYQLDIFIGDFKQELFGYEMTTYLGVIWNLSQGTPIKTIWQKLVISRHTQTGSFSAATRLRKANEGAARENIKEGLKLLSEADGI